MLLVTLFYGCMPSGREGIYSETVAIIPEDLRKFFPDYVAGDDYGISFNHSPYANDHVGEIVYYYFECIPIEFDSLSALYRKQSIGRYQFSDSCNVVVYRFQDGFPRSIKGQEWRYEQWIRSLESCEGHFPIPNFTRLQDSTDFIRKKGLSSDYEVCVLQASNKQELAAVHYGPPIMMPEQWARGHSQGVCISDRKRKIIWWLIVW